MNNLLRISLSAFMLFAFFVPVTAYEIAEAVYPELPGTADSVEAFVPSGWAVEILETGDLNEDGQDDLLLVLKEDNPDNFMTNDPATPGVDEWDANPRILAVAFALLSGGFELILQNNDILPRHEDPCIDDPFSLAEIDNGVIHLYLHLWANAGTWYTSDSKFSFRYLDDSFSLVSWSNYTTKRNTGETWEFDLDYVSGEAALTIGNFSEEGDEDTAYEQPLPEASLYTMEEIGSLWDFYPTQSDLSWWEIEEEEADTEGEY